MLLLRIGRDFRQEKPRLGLIVFLKSACTRRLIRRRRSGRADGHRELDRNLGSKNRVWHVAKFAESVARQILSEHRKDQGHLAAY
jgi:hypothetical protein